jgi:hypothetical protein
MSLSYHLMLYIHKNIYICTYAEIFLFINKKNIIYKDNFLSKFKFIFISFLKLGYIVIITDK